MNQSTEGSWYLVTRAMIGSNGSKWKTISVEEIPIGNRALESVDCRVVFEIDEDTHQLTINVAGSSDPSRGVTLRPFGEDLTLGAIYDSIQSITYLPVAASVAFNISPSDDQVGFLYVEYHLTRPVVDGIADYKMT